MSSVACKSRNTSVWMLMSLFGVALQMHATSPRVGAREYTLVEQDAIDFESLLTAYSTRESSLHSLEVQWAEDVVQGMDNGQYDKYERKWRVLLEGDKVRTEESGTSGPSTGANGKEVDFLSAFDGKVGKGFANSPGVRSPVGFIDVKDRSEVLKVNNANVYPVLFALRPAMVLTSREMFRTPWTTENGELNGESVFVLKRKAGQGHTLEEVLFIDPSSLLIKRAVSSNQAIVLQWDIQYRDVDGQPVPVAWKWSNSYRDGRLDVAKTVGAVRVNINPRLAPAEFDLEFPVGTLVSDVPSGTTYVIGPTGDKNYFRREDIEHGATYDELFNGRLGQRQLTGNRWFRAWMICGNILAIVVISVLLWRRMHRKVANLDDSM